MPEVAPARTPAQAPVAAPAPPPATARPASPAPVAPAPPTAAPALVRRTVQLTVLGEFPQDLIPEIEAALRMQLGVHVLPTLQRDLPEEAYYKPRKRFRAEKLLEAIERWQQRDVSTLGMTQVDISTTKGKVKDWGVLGLGSLSGTSSVISTHRAQLDRPSYALYRFRVVSTAVHEVGHMLGLDHCTEPRCVMNDAEGSIKTVDASTGELGPECIAALDALSPASAAPIEAAPLPMSALGYRFEARKGELVVWRGALHAALPTALDVYNVHHVAAFADGKSIEVEHSGSCELHATQAFALSVLDARLANAEGMQAHRAQRYEQAVSAFRRAVSADPGFELAHSNLACALARSGQVRQAIDALRPLLQSNPVLAYSKAMTDPDLESVRGEPELRALRASTPGNAKLDATSMSVLSAGGAVAMVLRQESWGAASWGSHLVVIDAKSGRERVRVPLVEWTDPERGTVLPKHRAATQKRLDEASRWLRELGFSSDPSAVAIAFDNTPGRFPFPGTDLVARTDGARDGEVGLTRNGENVGGAALGHFTQVRATYLPSARAVAVHALLDTPEGCNMGDSSVVRVVALP